jgi:hypothetical protein
MNSSILIAVGILTFMAFLLFSMRKQLVAMFRGEPFSDPKLRELLDREKQKAKDNRPPDAS